MAKSLKQSNTYALFSFMSGIVALLSIASLYGTIVAGLMGVVFGALAAKTGHKLSGSVGIGLNVIALALVVILLLFLHAYPGKFE